MEIIKEQNINNFKKHSQEEKYTINYDIQDPYVECYTDGATVGHNGKLGTVEKVGIGIYCEELNIAYSAIVKGISNNEAEFLALIRGMELLLEHGVSNAQFYLDSQIIVTRAMRPFIKKMKPKHRNERMDNFQKQVLDLAEKFNSIHFQWIPREKNTIADELSTMSIL